MNHSGPRKASRREGNERMSASEYGSNYFCVMLEPVEENRPGDSVLLHADSIDIDASGTLKFTSLGRRPVGANPHAQDKPKEAKSQDSGAETAASNGRPELAAVPTRSGAEGFAQPRNGS